MTAPLDVRVCPGCLHVTADPWPDDACPGPECGGPGAAAYEVEDGMPTVAEMMDPKRWPDGESDWGNIDLPGWLRAVARILEEQS